MSIDLNDKTSILDTVLDLHAILCISNFKKPNKNLCSFQHESTLIFLWII